MLGAPVRHLFENILGIKQSSESVGYESIVISPVFPKTLNMASGSIRTNDGIISVLWERNKDSINLKVSLPKNKSAKLVVNGCEKLIVEESNITI
ncbi:MAG: hypothetical protein MJ236_07115 [Clostridia bacterium]|nr:hypothetical protein [Clostridia bacterium]